MVDFLTSGGDRSNQSYMTYLRWLMRGARRAISSNYVAIRVWLRLAERRRTSYRNSAPGSLLSRTSFVVDEPCTCLNSSLPEGLRFVYGNQAQDKQGVSGASFVIIRLDVLQHHGLAQRAP